jgi:hypothetical protein
MRVYAHWGGGEKINAQYGTKELDNTGRIHPQFVQLQHVLDTTLNPRRCRLLKALCSQWRCNVDYKPRHGHLDRESADFRLRPVQEAEYPGAVDEPL